MINYILSEIYATLKSKSFYITNAILFVIVFAGAIFFQTLIKHKVGNIYKAKDLIFLGIILNMSFVMIFVNWYICTSSYGKNLQTIPQSISIGVERSTIYFGKTIAAILIIIMSHLVLIAEAAVLTRFVFGKVAFSYFPAFFITWIYMLPIFISGIFFVSMLSVNGLKEANTLAIMVFVYIFSAQVFSLIALRFKPFIRLRSFVPSVLFNQLAENFMYDRVRFIPSTLIVGVALTIVSIIIGYSIFRNRDF